MDTFHQQIANKSFCLGTNSSNRLCAQKGAACFSARPCCRITSFLSTQTVTESDVKQRHSTTLLFHLRIPNHQPEEPPNIFAFHNSFLFIQMLLCSLFPQAKHCHTFAMVPIGPEMLQHLLTPAPAFISLLSKQSSKANLSLLTHKITQ